MTTPKPTFQEELIALMRRHRFAGVPERIATTIRTAQQANDDQALKEWLPRAITHMIRTKP